ncbi:sulfhydryl oxidase 1 [Amblyraja radiata]|uniref:sulfhydryl oxidase 1 n=1 Tax=Amblyraja radiata TaxID=386614 RepID=UPI0014023802|nr:sulfhydryl oxidase 1 [Amblyraja radiata]
MQPRWDAALLVTAAICFLPAGSGIGLYSQSDQVAILNHVNLDGILYNSSTAWAVEFYASWCGHCISFVPVWKALANDIKEWRPAVGLAVVNCANVRNRQLCLRFDVKSYPTIKLFKAFSAPFFKGDPYEGSERGVLELRHNLINHLENHGENEWPPSCPPLEPASLAEIQSFFVANDVQYLALIFEEETSYVGREVTLDMLQFENIAVRRVLPSEESLMQLLGVHTLPSLYLYFKDNTHQAISVKMETRIFYTYYLRRLPGVTRGAYKLTVNNSADRATMEPWKDFNSSRVYMSDLESALYYSLKMEVGKHQKLSGDTLTALQHFIAVLTKLFPGRPFIMKVLQITDTWLANVGTENITFRALTDVLDNKNETSGAILPDRVSWVGCQGSRPHFRGYPCSVWTLFHLLTVQAAKQNESMVLAGQSVETDPLEVLYALRQYVKHFFGCRECASHFEAMAAESMDRVNSFNQAVLWLWSRHNHVNNRLAGALSEDPKFPKLQWPPPDMCVECHNDANGHHMWVKDALLNFLLGYYSPDNIDYSYLEEEETFLERQKAREGTWKDQGKPGPEEEEEKKEKGKDLGKEEGESKEPPTMREEQRVDHTVVRRIRSQKRTFVKWKRATRMEVDDILDLDSIQYKNQAKSRTENKRTSLENNRYHGPKLHLQSIDDSDFYDVPVFRERLQNWVVGSRQLWDQVSPKKKWMSMLGVNLSHMDTGLCVLLYCLSALCLLSMYLYLRVKFRWWKWKYWFTSVPAGVQHSKERKW